MNAPTLKSSASSIEQLKQQLQTIKEANDQKWVNNLIDRKIKEIEYSDIYHGTADSEGQWTSHKAAEHSEDQNVVKHRNFYTGAIISDKFINGWIHQHAPNKIFLDYACGNGLLAIQAAKAGATLAIGIDLSGQSIANAAAVAAKEGVSHNTFFLQADAENTQLPAQSIDTVVCAGMLHHVDLSYAFPELRRILKPGGRILAAEALDYNPIIKLYRNLTPGIRTAWEKDHILSLKDVRFGKRFFQLEEIRYWHLTSILTPYAPALLPAFNAIDRILTKIPLVRLMAWMFTFEFVKPLDENTSTESESPF